MVDNKSLPSWVQELTLICCYVHNQLCTLCINYCYIQKEGTIFNPSSIASLFSHFVMEGFVKYSVCNVYTFIQLLAPTKSYLTQTFTCLFCGQLSPSHIKHKLSVNESQRNKGNECHCLYDPTLSEGVYHCLL